LRLIRQKWVPFLAPSGLVAITWLLLQAESRTALLWLLGLALGFALHRSRFCVAAAFRDSVLFRDVGLARAVILALALSTLTFSVIQYTASTAGQPVPGNIYAISAATLVGAVLFGIGLVPAGGCACSTLLRLGEGHSRYLWTLLGLLTGSLAGASHFGWWEGLWGILPPIHLPAVIGWTATLTLQMALFSALALLLNWWEKKGCESPWTDRSST